MGEEFKKTTVLGDSFFKNEYHTDGKTIFEHAKSGDRNALDCLNEFGKHLGDVLKMILYTYDSEIIILGGSVKEAYPYFQKALWKEVKTYVYPNSLEKFQIKVSSLKNCGVLGAVALYYNEEY